MRRRHWQRREIAQGASGGPVAVPPEEDRPPTPPSSSTKRISSQARVSIAARVVDDPGLGQCRKPISSRFCHGSGCSVLIGAGSAAPVEADAVALQGYQLAKPALRPKADMHRLDLETSESSFQVQQSE